MSIKMPKIHPREKEVIKAKQELGKCMIKIMSTLTEGELMCVLSDELISCFGGIAKHKIRMERHPDDPTKPGGWK